MAEFPKISLVTPSLNQGEYLEQALLSVLAQDYPDLELIVVDGGSADRSQAIIEQYRDRLTAVICEPDDGQVDALEKGFTLASGELLGWLNADDRLLPGSLEAVARTYRGAQRPCVLVGAGRMLDADGRLLFERWPTDLSPATTLAWRDWFMQAAVFFPADSYRQIGGLARDLDYAFDFDLWVRLSQRLPFIAVPKLLAEHTRHAEAKTERFRGRSFAETRLVQIRHGGAELALQTIDELFLHDQALQLREQKRLVARVRRAAAQILHRLRARQRIYNRRPGDERRGT